MYVEPMPAQKLVLAMLQPGCLSEKRENHMDNPLQCLKVMNLSGFKKKLFPMNGCPVNLHTVFRRAQKLWEIGMPVKGLCSLIHTT